MPKTLWSHVGFALIMAIVLLAAATIGAGTMWFMLQPTGTVTVRYLPAPTRTVLKPVTPTATVAPTIEPTVAPTAMALPDFCADQVNPAWANLIERNSLTREVYEAWAGEVRTTGGTVFGASKCSMSVDSRIFGPGDTIKGSGPAQLVTEYRFTGIWQPSVDITYKLAKGCSFTPLFAQGDAPVAFWATENGVRLASNVSNGVSLVGTVACP